MDFRQTIQPNPRPAASNQPVAAPTGHEDGPKHDTNPHPEKNPTTWLKIFSVVVLFGVAVLLCAIALGFGRSQQSSNEKQYVDTSKYQAVFLTNGQVYFGNIDNLNGQYIHMKNIYYLTQSTGSDSSSSNSYSLTKLGCQQIHDPSDAMTINRDTVTFWENLEDGGKVVKSIKEFKQKFPSGPDCSQVSNQTQADSTNTQGSSTDTSSTNK